MSNENGKAKVALILGAADEVGEGIALSLAKKGVALALCDNAGTQLEAVGRRAAREGAEAAAIPLAGLSAESAAKTVGKALARFGQIDILINHTPEPPKQHLGTISAQAFDATIATILGMQAHFLREVLPGMRRNGYGRVINVGGLAYLGSAKASDVAAAQAGLFGLTRSAALEAARDNVTVNVVIPGELEQAERSPEEAAALANGIPVKRLGTPADIAHAVSFLASEKSKYITGQTLFVCGGKSVYYSMSV